MKYYIIGAIIIIVLMVVGFFLFFASGPPIDDINEKGNLIGIINPDKPSQNLAVCADKNKLLIVTQTSLGETWECK